MFRLTLVSTQMQMNLDLFLASISGTPFSSRLFAKPLAGTGSSLRTGNDCSVRGRRPLTSRLYLVSLPYCHTPPSESPGLGNSQDEMKGESLDQLCSLQTLWVWKV